MVMDGANQALYATNYDPYGNPIAVGGLTQSAFGFTGQQTDATGLQYLRARYYSPANGTFLTADPVLGVAGGSASTFNPYSYVRGNTVNLTDPSGRFPFLLLALGAAVGFAAGAIFDIYNQLQANGGNWNCIDLGQVGSTAALGALIGGLAAPIIGAIAMLPPSLAIPAAVGHCC